MATPLTAIEATGIIDKNQRLHLDRKLPVKGPQRVRVIVLYPDDEISEKEWVYAASHNPEKEHRVQAAKDFFAKWGGILHDESIDPDSLKLQYLLKKYE